MLIELQEPFRSTYKAGYLNPDETGRKKVLFTNLAGKIVGGMSYARYLVCVHLGYILAADLEVDHIDDDKTNDVLSNLQILTKQENILKQQYKYVMTQQVCYGFCCAKCETYFILTERDVKNRQAAGTVFAFCSRSCARSYHGAFHPVK